MNPATTEQPAPKGTGADIARLVQADIEARAQKGEAAYGERLRAHNGRDALVDAYQERLDDVMYTRQMIEEREDLRAEVERLRALVEERPNVPATVWTPEAQRFWEALVNLSDKADFKVVIGQGVRCERLLKAERARADAAEALLREAREAIADSRAALLGLGAHPRYVGSIHLIDRIDAHLAAGPARP
jgi:hypothetical protein